jgi:hypothetical protein
MISNLSTEELKQRLDGKVIDALETMLDYMVSADELAADYYYEIPDEERSNHIFNTMLVVGDWLGIDLRQPEDDES